MYSDAISSVRHEPSHFWLFRLARGIRSSRTKSKSLKGPSLWEPDHLRYHFTIDIAHVLAKRTARKTFLVCTCYPIACVCKLRGRERERERWLNPNNPTEYNHMVFLFGFTPQGFDELSPDELRQADEPRIWTASTTFFTSSKVQLKGWDNPKKLSVMTLGWVKGQTTKRPRDCGWSPIKPL